MGQIPRRRFLIVAGALLAAPLAAEAQQSGKVPRIGVLTLGIAYATPFFEAFRQGLREQGYVEGRSIAIEYRFAQGRVDSLPAMAAELVRLDVDVIVTESSPAALAAKQATRTIPIVMAAVGDPVKLGLVASLARPGGNITGLTLFELIGKRLQLLRDIVPKTTLVAAMYNAANPNAQGSLDAAKAAAQSLGMPIRFFEVRSPADFDAAFKAVAEARPDGFITLADGMLLGNRARIVEFAAKSRLPGVFGEREYAEAGALMSYGPSIAANFRRAAAYVDKILKGAKPADLPVERPAKFDMVINLKTAKALALTLPQAVLLQADTVIE